jgi:hypothetical protein
MLVPQMDHFLYTQTNPHLSRTRAESAHISEGVKCLLFEYDPPPSQLVLPPVISLLTLTVACNAKAAL